MEIIVEMASKTSREYNGRVKWGVHPKGSPKDYWVDIYYPERPKVGQVFNIGAIKETQSKDGAKIFREAEIIGPAEGNGWPERPQQAQQAQPSQVHQPAPQRASTAQPGGSNGKIKWDDWVQIAMAASELAYKMEPEPATSPNDHAPAARMAFVQTCLVALRDGKLELPTEAGPVEREPGDDGDAYKDPNNTVPWGDWVDK